MSRVIRFWDVIPEQRKRGMNFLSYRNVERAEGKIDDEVEKIASIKWEIEQIDGAQDFLKRRFGVPKKGMGDLNQSQRNILVAAAIILGGGYLVMDLMDRGVIG